MRTIHIAIISGLAAAAAMPTNAQNTKQSLTVTLTLSVQTSDALGNLSPKTVRVTNKDLIQSLTGTAVPNGQLLLVTPLASGAATNEGNMNAFLRITQKGATVAEVQTPDFFNLYQDAVTVNQRAGSSSAIDRFSLASGGAQFELQGFTSWTPPRGRVVILRPGFPISFATSSPISAVPGSGTFTSVVNGTGTFDGVTPPNTPMQGTITAGAPTLE